MKKIKFDEREKWIVETGKFRKIVKANNWKEAIISAFALKPPIKLGMLTRLVKLDKKPNSKNKKERFVKWNYIDSRKALKIAGYSIIK